VICTGLPPLNCSIFLNLVVLHIYLDCIGDLATGFIDVPSAFDFESLLPWIPNVEDLALWNILASPIRPPVYLANQALISLPLPLRILELSFDATNEQLPAIIPFLQRLVVSHNTNVRFVTSARLKLCRKISAIFAASRPPLRVHVSTDPLNYNSVWHNVKYVSHQDGQANGSMPLTSLEFIDWIGDPLAGLSLSNVTHLIFTRVFILQLSVIPKVWWRVTFARAPCVRALQLSLDDRWFPPAMRALTPGDDEEALVLPLLERLVFTDPAESKAYPDPHATRLALRSRRLDAIRRCLVARARADAPVSELVLPRRFEGVDWLDDVRYLVQKLSFEHELSLQDWE
jgi:hypothetical protein